MNDRLDRDISMVDLKSQYTRLKSDIDKAIAEVIDQSNFIKGSALKNFEQELAQYLNVKHVIGVGNGTDALQIALKPSLFLAELPNQIGFESVL